MRKAPLFAVTIAEVTTLLLLSAGILCAEDDPKVATNNPPRRSPGESIHEEKKVDPLNAMRTRSEDYYTTPTPSVSSPTQRTVTKTKPAEAKPPEPAVKPLPKPFVAPSIPSNYSTPTVRSSTDSRLTSASRYPWKKQINTTVFWIGEKPSGANKTPNLKSSWDTNWMKNYGGYDDPNPANRAPDFRPKSFVPGLNPFYIALPYNDRAAYNKTKSEAPRVIPWFRQTFQRPGQSVCKGRWIAIHYKGKICYGQWEDCGPFNTDDWQYVFGNAKPKTQGNGGAGLEE